MIIQDDYNWPACNTSIGNICAVNTTYMYLLFPLIEHLVS